MSKMKVYQYPKCSTCKKALKWLDEKQVDYSALHIVEQTPDKNELKLIIERSGMPFKKFFNTSGLKYRELGLKDKIASMTIDEAVELLSGDGMLIKRPLLVKDDVVLTGFKADQWETSKLS